MSLRAKTTKWRALIDLVYSDLTDKVGQPLAKKGDITELYPEILAYPDRIELAERMGFIEPIPETPIVRTVKSDSAKE